MAEKKCEKKTEEKKGGKGKFLLGATLGAIAGAAAGMFISKKAREADEENKKDYYRGNNSRE